MFAHEQQEQLRAATIELFHRYLRARGELLRLIGVTDNASEDDIKLLSKDAEYLAAQRYLLAVVGEAKSGKSTFINSLLGREILPTGVLQCTSGIIEIVDTAYRRGGSKVFLRVQYGRAPEPRLEYEHAASEDIGPMRKMLATVAAVREEYRALPIFQLNQQLLEDCPTEITDEYVTGLLATMDDDGKALFENPHRLPPDAFTRLARRYLDEYSDLQKIPVNVTVGYPLGLGYSDLRIVDTPGVNARGGLKKATLSYMLAANAVLLLHPADNIASESLETFFKRHVPDEVKKNTFLFLTHAWPKTRTEIDMMLQEARRLYPDNEIQPGRIVVIDSMLKDIVNRIDAGGSLADLQNDEALMPYLAQYLVRFGSDINRVRQALTLDANFNAAEELLREFAGRAFENQVRGILDRIDDAYREQNVIYDERIHLLGNKMTRPPEDFEAEIEELKGLLEKYEMTLGAFSVNIQKEFAGRGETEILFDDIRKKYTKAINGAVTVDELRKHALDFNKDCAERLAERVNTLREKYEAKMEELGQTFQAEYAITPPKIRLDAIAKDAEESAYDFITIPGDRKIRAVKGGIIGAILGGIGGFFLAGPPGAVLGAALLGGATAGGEYLDGTPNRTQKVRSERKYFEEFRDRSIIEVDRLSGDMLITVSKSAMDFATAFNSKLAATIEKRNDSYDQLVRARSEAEALRDESRFLEGQKDTTSRDRIAIKELCNTLR